MINIVGGTEYIERSHRRGAGRCGGSGLKDAVYDRNEVVGIDGERRESESSLPYDEAIDHPSNPHRDDRARLRRLRLRLRLRLWLLRGRRRWWVLIRHGFALLLSKPFPEKSPVLFVQHLTSFL